MPRPPKSITSEDFQSLYPQLARLLADPEKAAQSINGSPELATAAFSAVRDAPHLLNEWVSHWLTSAAKRRMWASLRQMAYKKRQNARTLVISDEAYSALATIAKSHHLTLSDAILFLTKEER
jgi:macrodomain Ter protein organizer (MatP/YcbG family)